MSVLNLEINRAQQLEISMSSRPLNVSFSRTGGQGPKGDLRVPLFDSTHDMYVEGDIVRNENDTAFINTFAEATPAGTVLTDTTYWIPLADVDEAVVAAAVQQYLEDNPVGASAGDFNTLGDVVATEVGDDIQLDVNWNTWPYPFVSSFTLPANSFWIDEGVVWRWMGNDGFEITSSRYRANHSGIVEKDGNSNWERHQTLAPIVAVHDRDSGTTYQGRLAEVDINHDDAGLRIGFYDEDLAQTGYLNIDYQDKIGTGTPEAPTTGSNNPITSGQVFTGLEGRVSNDKVADTYVEGTTADTDLLEVRALKELIAAEGGGSDVAAFVAGQAYDDGENFTLDNKLYAVNGTSAEASGFANAAAAISGSTLLVDGDIGTGGAVDTALRDTPDNVANDTAWLAFINGLGVSGGSDVAELVLNQAYAAGENFTFNNRLYSVNDASSGFSSAAAAVLDSTLLVNGDAATDVQVPAYDENSLYVAGDFVYNPTNGILYRAVTNHTAGTSLTDPALWQSIGGATQFAPIPATAENLTSIGVPDDTVGANLLLSSNNDQTGLGTPNDRTRIFGTGNVTVTAHGDEDVIVINGTGGGVENVLDLETVFSFEDDATGLEYFGYVNNDLFGTATITDTSGVTGTWTITGHTFEVDSIYVVAWDSSYAIGRALTSGTLDILRYHVHSGDSEPDTSGTGQAASTVNLENVQQQNQPTANETNIESLTQHNHEQDARIAALEHQDITTTISSFDTSTVLTNLFTSGTIINKGNINDNLYQAWTITREGHELIGYLQLTDTERDSFRNEFSLVQGSSSNIYIPANPDAPHTIGIKAFAAADYNDLSANTQVMLGQISSMRFGGSVGAETMFEIRWELLNYSDAIDTSLDTVDSGQIYGASGDLRYAFYANTLYTTPAWEFREATVSRTEVITTGADTALRDTPDDVADDAAWLAFINKLGISGDTPSGDTFPTPANGTPGDLFVLTVATGHGDYDANEADLLYIGLYVLVRNSNGTNEWIHANEYKTTPVDLAYPSGADNGVTFYGNKGVQDVAQDVIDTAARVYTEMNTALALKSDTATSVVDGDIAVENNRVTGITIGSAATPLSVDYDNVTGTKPVSNANLYQDSDAQSALNISSNATSITYRDSNGAQQTFTPTSGGEGVAPTVANVEPLFANSTGDRGVTVSPNSGNTLIDITVAEDTGKENAVTYSLTPPSNPYINQQWHDLNDGTRYVWSGVAWVGDTVVPADQEDATVITTLTGTNDLGNNFSMRTTPTSWELLFNGVVIQRTSSTGQVFAAGDVGGGETL